MSKAPCIEWSEQDSNRWLTRLALAHTKQGLVQLSGFVWVTSLRHLLLRGAGAITL